MALVEAALFENGFEAGAARGCLSAEGIECFIFDFNVGAAGFPAIRLMVDEEDLQVARRALEAGPFD